MKHSLLAFVDFADCGCSCMLSWQTPHTKTTLICICLYIIPICDGMLGQDCIIRWHCSQSFVHIRLHCGRWDNGTVENETWPQFWVQDSRVRLNSFICSTCPEGCHRGCRCGRAAGRSKVCRPLLKFLRHWRLRFWLRRSSRTGKQQAGRMPVHSSYLANGSPAIRVSKVAGL